MDLRRRTRGARVLVDVEGDTSSSSDEDGDNVSPEPDNDGIEEGEEYVEADQSRVERGRFKRTRQVIANALEVDLKSPLLNVYSKTELINLDLTHQLQIPDLVSLIFELSGFPASLFDPEETKEHHPSVLAESCVGRCEEMNVVISPVSMLLIPQLRVLAKQRVADLESLRQKTEHFQGLGLSGAPLKAKAQNLDKEQAEILESYSLVTKNSKLKVFDELRQSIHQLFFLMFTSSGDDEVLNTKLPYVKTWIEVLCVSPVRPLRYTGVFLLGRLAFALLARMADMGNRFRVLLSQVPTTSRIADLTGSIKDTLKHCVTITSFIHGIFKDIVCARHQDVSWHIQYEVLTLSTSLALQSPFFWLLGVESSYVPLWISLASHTNPEVRLLCFDSLMRLFEVFHERFAKDDLVDPSFDFTFPSDPSLSIVKVAISGEIRILEGLRPPVNLIGERMQDLMHRVLSKVLLHVRDSDIRVCTTAAKCLATMGRFENTWGAKYALALSDESVTRAVSLLFSAESSVLAKVEVAKFVDTAIFQSSIINEQEVTDILNYSTQSALPSLNAERVMSMSVELNTFVEFLRDFANTPAWQARHIQAIEAFWTLSPFLHFWDLILDHLCVAFNQTAVISEDSRTSLAASWVRSESIETLFSLLLGLIEIERASLNGVTRYYALPEFKTLEGHTPGAATFKNLSEIACTGFRLSSSDIDDLWKFKTDNTNMISTYKIRRLATRFRHVWRLAPHLIEGSKSSATLYSTCLCIMYELITGTDALLFTEVFGLIETDLDFKAIESSIKVVVDVVLGQLSLVQDRKGLQASYALLHKIARNFPPTESVPPSLSGVLAVRKELSDRISLFFVSYRTESLKTASLNAKKLLVLERGSEEAHRLNAAYRSSLVHLTALTENDSLNPFREGIETLDDLIGIVELKVNLMNSQFSVKGSPMEPSDHLTTLTFELIWIALARWMEQIESRYVGYILPELERLTGAKVDPAPDLATRALHFEQDVNRSKQLEEHFKTLKEDLDIFKELLSQLLGFAAKYSEGLRGRLQRAAPENLAPEPSAMYTRTEDPSKLEEERHIHRKTMLLAAVCTMRLILNATFFHTLSRLWLMIEQSVCQLLDRGHVQSSKLLKCATDIKDLCQACRDPPRTESAHEVAFFLDQLRQLSVPHRRLLTKNKLEGSFSLPELSYGILSAFGSVSPSPTGVISMCDVYRDCTTEEGVVTACQSLPGISEMAYICHIQLMATICQIPDPGLWKEASIGAVILTGLNSANVVLQTMAKIYLDRLKLYDATRQREIEKLKLTVKSADMIDAIFEENSEPTMLCQILCGVIAQLLDRIQNSSNRNLEEARLVAANAAQHLYPHYFVDLTNEEFNKFAWHVIRLSWVEPATPKVDGILLDLITVHLLKGRLLKRKWKSTEASDCISQIKANFNAYFDQIDSEKFSDRYFEALERFFRVCYPVSRKQGPIIEVNS